MSLRSGRTGTSNPRGGPLGARLETLLTPEKLAKLAGEKSFARGTGYFNAGAVTDLVQTRDAINATVAGNEDYRVLLRPKGSSLEWSCTCPLGEERAFCKHAVATGRAAEAAELAGYAMRRGIAAYEKTDDSGGNFGETLHQLAALHLEICRAAKPEPEAFGKSLFELQMRDEWGFFSFEHYAPLLEKKGLARYRALAEAAWKEVPAREPGARSDARADYYRITALMEALARHSGDVDALVAVESRDLSHPYRFVRVAEILAKAGRHAEALAWAERGRKAFPQDLDSRLVDFLAAAYHREKRDAEAIALAWEYFAAHPRLDAYQRLAKCAGRAKAWKTWREKALAHIRTGLERPDRKDAARHWTGGGHTLLVEIFLHEGDSDAALAEAKSGDCTRGAWMQIAHTREKDHPADAAAIYRDSIDGIVNQTNNRAYDDAAQLAGKIRALMQRAGQRDELAAWLEALRAKHKAKRNFMQRIEGLS